MGKYRFAICCSLGYRISRMLTSGSCSGWYGVTKCLGRKGSIIPCMYAVQESGTDLLSIAWNEGNIDTFMSMEYGNKT